MLAGRLGADPETRFTTDGKKVTTMRLAVNVRKGKEEKTMWWRLTIWGEEFDRMMPYFKKGSAVIAFGDMAAPEIYNGKDGTPQVSLDMTVRDLKFSPFGKPQSQEDSMQQQQQQPQMAAQTQAPAYGQGAPSQNFSDDEIPF